MHVGNGLGGIMKKLDFLWIGILLALFAFIAYPATREMFIGFTTAHAYIGGFLKFAILATMGELLAIRLAKGDWVRPAGLGYRAIIWGFLGIVIVLIFAVFAGGVTAALSKGMLPFGGYALTFAFSVSLIMNCTFAPTMMAFHKLTDTYIDLKHANKGQKIKLERVVKTVDWNRFVSFVVLKTIPFFWIPAHTITFMLPPEYRVLMAAALSLALGLILSIKPKAVKTINSSKNNDKASTSYHKK